MTAINLKGIALSVFDEQTDNAEEKSTIFRRLIEGEYKNEFTREFQKVFDRRFKEKKEKEESSRQTQEILQLLAERLGAQSADPAELLDVLQKEQAEQVTALSKEDYISQTEQLQGIYSEFDFDTEVQDPEFVRLLHAGVPLRQAYEVLHLEDIVKTMVERQKEELHRQITDSIRARAVRPYENALAAHSGMTVTQDVSRLTREQRENYARRAAAGEEITFTR